MKKLITITAIVLVVTCLVGVFAGCSGASRGVKIKKAKVTTSNVDPDLFASVKEISDLAGLDLDNSNSNQVFTLARKYEEGKYRYTLYNNVEDSTVFKGVILDEVEVYDCAYTTTTYSDNDMATTILYDAKGNIVSYKDASGEAQEKFTGPKTEIPELTPVSENIYLYAGCYYRVDTDNRKIEFIKRQSEMATNDYDGFTYSNDNYYYNITDTAAYIYNKKLDLVTSYYYASSDGLYYFDENNYKQRVGLRRARVLESGDLIMQYFYQEPDSEKSYDLILDGNKYSMKTVIVKAKNGKVSEKKFKYVITGLYANDVNWNDPVKYGKVENFATLYPIESKKLLKGVNDNLVVSLSNRLSIKGRLDKMIDNQLPGTMAQKLNNYLVFQTKTGYKLVTTSGNVVGDINLDNYNQSFFDLNGKLYDFSLKMVYDYEAKGYEISNWMAHSVILRKDGEYYRFDKDEPVLICSTSATFSYINKSIYQVTGDSFSYYNDKGEKINNLPNTTVTTIRYDAKYGYYICGATVDGAQKYYRVTK